MDAEDILKASGDQPNEKALFRAARGLYELARYEEAQRYLDQLAVAFPQNRDAKSILAKTKQRRAEQQYGKYDWAALIGEARKSAPRLEIADHLGSVRLSEKGYLVAKSDIRSGELLLCTKAIDVLYPADLAKERLTLVYDVTEDVLSRGEGWRLTRRISGRITQNPESANNVYSLLNGLELYKGNSAVARQSQIVDGRTITDM